MITSSDLIDFWQEIYIAAIRSGCDSLIARSIADAGVKDMKHRTRPENKLFKFET